MATGPIGSQESALMEMRLQQRACMIEREINSFQPLLPPNQVDLLEKLFENVYLDLQPQARDYSARSDAIKFVERLVRDKLSVGDAWKRCGSCCVKAFGSFTMDMFTPSSDLDISLHVDDGAAILPREEKIRILRKLTRILYSVAARNGIVRDVQPILKAKVPVVKFIICRTGLECDISAENRDGVMKSELLRIFSLIDPRFRKLCFLVKAWANAQGINSSKDQTLNSLSIILLVAFHLQTRSPAILPPFSVLLEGLPYPFTSQAIAVIEKRVHTYKDFGKSNQEKVVELFNSLLLQLAAVETMWQQGLCASTYKGTWTLARLPGCIFVEDFSALSQNAARAVNGIGFKAIYKRINETVTQLRAYPIEISRLERLLFKTVSASVNQGKRHADASRVFTDEGKQELAGHMDDLRQDPSSMHFIGANEMSMHKDYPSKRMKMFDPIVVNHPFEPLSLPVGQGEIGKPMPWNQRDLDFHYQSGTIPDHQAFDHIRFQARPSLSIPPTVLQAVAMRAHLLQERQGYIGMRGPQYPAHELPHIHHRLPVGFPHDPNALSRLTEEYDRSARWHLGPSAASLSLYRHGNRF